MDYASLAVFDHLHNVKIGEMTQEMKKYYSEGQGFWRPRKGEKRYKIYTWECLQSRNSEKNNK